MLIGVISDTHGLLRPEVLAALEGSDVIIHAGDVGRADIIDTLNAIAPTFAVRGNVDTQDWARALPDTRVVEVGGMRLYVLHIRAELSVDPVAAGYAAVIFGHSHKPSIEQRSGVLYLNPGSAGRRRFRLPVSVGRLRATRRTLDAEIVELQVR
jgi:putative phosphoesterase